MDFDLTPEAVEAAQLAATIFKDHCTPERLRAVDQLDGRFDPHLWKAAADAGLLGLALPEAAGGSGLGVIELAAVLVEQGRTVGPIPLSTHVVAAMAIAEFGDDALRQRWLPAAVSGDSILTAATAPDRTGAFSVVPGAPLAAAFVLPVVVDGVMQVLVIERDAAGVSLDVQVLNDGDHAGRLTLDPVALSGAPSLGGQEVLDWLADRLDVAAVAHQLGVVDGALALTAEYARTREQFGRPIATFQAVSQRLADGYIDVLGARLMLWQAAWRLAEGLPSTVEVAGARLWAADAGHRLAHTAVHVHGGVGIDLDGETHRYFTAAKRGEFQLGGTTAAALVIGAELAAARS